MKPEFLKYLCCPECRGALALNAQETEGGRVKGGSLDCAACRVSYRITRFIPRLVASTDNYADDFGYQWNRHYRTQYDAYSGVPVSEERFFKETEWPRNMEGQLLLEAGSGSGRFTEHAASTGATVISFDFSHACEANYRNNGRFDNVLILQADLYKMPFPDGQFDKVLCIGVLQHTPDPERSFLELSRMLRQGANLVVDAYHRLPGIKRFLETKYWVRPLTRRIPNEKLYNFCERWVKLMWPVCKLSYTITGRRSLSWFLCVADYRGVYPLTEDKLQEWSILDTFDMLAPEYDFPQTLESVQGWFEKAGLMRLNVKYGYNGIQGSGFKG